MTWMGAGWVISAICLRLFLEDLLCIDRVGFSGKLEWVHMLLWWVSVYIMTAQVLQRLSKRSLISVFRFSQIWIWGIWLPPILDWWLIRRTFDYPYPTGGLSDYANWMLGFMPTFVTPGQKIEIVFLLLLVGVFVSAHRSLIKGAGAILLVYFLLSCYAWYPAFFQSFWPFSRANHDQACIMILTPIVVHQCWCIPWRRYA